MYVLRSTPFFACNSFFMHACYIADSTEDSLQQLARSISNERKRDSVSSTSSCDSPGMSIAS